jgi:hypothetical protein
MPTPSDITKALNALRSKIKPNDIFSARDVARELGADDDQTALAVARALLTVRRVEPKTIGAGANPDGFWGFI